MLMIYAILRLRNTKDTKQNKENKESIKNIAIFDVINNNINFIPKI